MDRSEAATILWALSRSLTEQPNQLRADFHVSSIGLQAQGPISISNIHGAPGGQTIGLNVGGGQQNHGQAMQLARETITRLNDEMAEAIRLVNVLALELDHEAPNRRRLRETLDQLGRLSAFPAAMFEVVATTLSLAGLGA